MVNIEWVTGNEQTDSIFEPYSPFTIRLSINCS